MAEENTETNKESFETGNNENLGDHVVFIGNKPFKRA